MQEYQARRMRMRSPQLIIPEVCLDAAVVLS